MPTKKKPLRDLPKIPKELLEQFGEGLMTAEAIEDASAAFKKALIEGSVRFFVCGPGSVRFFVCGPVTACRQAGPDFHQVGLMNRSPYKIAN